MGKLLMFFKGMSWKDGLIMLASAAAALTSSRISDYKMERAVEREVAKQNEENNKEED